MVIDMTRKTISLSIDCEENLLILSRKVKVETFMREELEDVGWRK